MQEQRAEGNATLRKWCSCGPCGLRKREAAREKGRGGMWGLYQAHAGDRSRRTDAHQDAKLGDV